VAHPDLDQLFNEALPFAQEMLAKHGEFYPFAVSMTSEGEVVHVGADTGDDNPSSPEVIDLLAGGLREQANRRGIRAAALCVDVRTIPPGETEKRDAICARLEHANGETVDVFVPYRKGWLGKPKYGDLFAAQGEHHIFRDGSNA